MTMQERRLTVTCLPICSLCGDAPNILALETQFGSYLEQLDAEEKLCFIASIANHLASHASEDDEEDKIEPERSRSVDLKDSYLEVRGALPYELEEMLPALDEMSGSDLAMLMYAVATFTVQTRS